VDSFFIEICGNVLSIENSELLNEGNLIYPNPANENLIIDFPLNEGRVELISAQGKVVMKSQIDSYGTLEISAIENGIYLVKVYQKNDAILTRRIVIKH
jgi:hypothetical protein